jgi:hypothetical protein
MIEAVVENLRSAVYASYEELAAQVQADSALLADLGATSRLNHEGLELRRRALAAAVSAPVVFGLLYGLFSAI